MIALPDPSLTHLMNEHTTTRTRLSLSLSHLHCRMFPPAVHPTHAPTDSALKSKAFATLRAASAVPNNNTASTIERALAAAARAVPNNNNTASTIEPAAAKTAAANELWKQKQQEKREQQLEQLHYLQLELWK